MRSSSFCRGFPYRGFLRLGLIGSGRPVCHGPSDPGWPARYWGQIDIQGIPSGTKRPIVSVLLLAEGVERGRTQINDEGYFYFLERPRDGQYLVVNIGGTEIGRRR